MVTNKKLTIIGKGASGKDYLKLKLLKQYDFRFSIPFTTRPIRPEEQDGVDYFFLTKGDIDESKVLYKTDYKITESETWTYGMYVDEFEKSNLVVISPYDFINLSDEIKKSMFVVYIDCPSELIYSRLKDRVSPDSIQRRMSTDDEIFSKINTSDIDFVIKGVVSDESIEQMINSYLHA